MAGNWEHAIIRQTFVETMHGWEGTPHQFGWFFQGKMTVEPKKGTKNGFRRMERRIERRREEVWEWV
jgi:hypothetical protein